MWSRIPEQTRWTLQVLAWWTAVLLFVGVPFLSERSGHVSAQPFAGGTHANAWSAVAVSSSGVSTAFDTIGCRAGVTTVFGNTGGASTLTVQYSQNNATFYSSAVNTGSVSGNFGLSFAHGARYVRLISSAAVTITATIACK